MSIGIQSLSPRFLSSFLSLLEPSLIPFFLSDASSDFLDHAFAIISYTSFQNIHRT